MKQKKIVCPKCGKKGTLCLYPAATNKTPTDEAAIFHAGATKRVGVFVFNEVTEHCYFKEWPVKNVG